MHLLSSPESTGEKEAFWDGVRAGGKHAGGWVVGERVGPGPDMCAESCPHSQAAQYNCSLPLCHSLDQ